MHPLKAGLVDLCICWKMRWYKFNFYIKWEQKLACLCGTERTRAAGPMFIVFSIFLCTKLSCANVFLFDFNPLCACSYCTGYQTGGCMHTGDGWEKNDISWKVIYCMKYIYHFFLLLSKHCGSLRVCVHELKILVALSFESWMGSNYVLCEWTTTRPVPDQFALFYLF